VSPIRAENVGRYPPNWREVSAEIRFMRAAYVCECEGECGNPHALPGRCTARHGSPHPVTRSAVVLTVAHLDHTPENCALDNLKAMCQRCHLSYDGKHHAANAARTRAERLATGMESMFGDGAA
jgi:hypothetical protein